MNKTGKTSAKGEDVTSSGVGALIERLRQQGVDAGRAAREKIVAEAEREAERIIKEARDKASAIVDEGAANAERLRASGEDALRVATRDTVLRMRETLRERLEAQVRRLVSKQLADEGFLRELIIEVARRARRDSGVGHAENIEVLLPPEVMSLEELQGRPEEVESKLTTFAKEIASATWRDGVAIGALEPGARGIRIRLSDDEIEIDLTDQSIADLLLKHLQPRFRLIMEGIVW